MTTYKFHTMTKSYNKADILDVLFSCEHYQGLLAVVFHGHEASFEVVSPEGLDDSELDKIGHDLSAFLATE